MPTRQGASSRAPSKSFDAYVREVTGRLEGGRRQIEGFSRDLLAGGVRLAANPAILAPTALLVLADASIRRRRPAQILAPKAVPQGAHVRLRAGSEVQRGSAAAQVRVSAPTLINRSTPRRGRPSLSEGLMQADTAVRTAADILAFGKANELAAAVDATLDIGNGNTWRARYEDDLAQQQVRDDYDEENRKFARDVGQVSGAGLGIALLARRGLGPVIIPKIVPDGAKI